MYPDMFPERSYFEEKIEGTKADPPATFYGDSETYCTET
jgi:hypothetical protein